MSNLYIVATPIGNLEDVTLRALRVLREADFILAEDTRVTRKLLEHYEIKTPLISYHQHSNLSKLKQIESLIQAGKNLALVSDAGTPGISDPGNKLIEHLVNSRTIGQSNDLTITPVPGPSAVTALLGVSGFPTDDFVFLGFPPHKKGRQKFFQNLMDEKTTVIFYESCHRIIKCLEALAGLGLKRQMAVGNDLTKKFERIYRGKVESVLEQIKQNPVKGEYVVTVNRD